MAPIYTHTYKHRLEGHTNPFSILSAYIFYGDSDKTQVLILLVYLRCLFDIKWFKSCLPFLPGRQNNPEKPILN